MKTLIVILIIFIAVIGWFALKPELKFFPEGNMGELVPFYSDLSCSIICGMCGETTPLYKVDSRNRIVCNECYRTHYK